MKNNFRGIITIKHSTTNRGDELAREMITLLGGMLEVKDIVSTSYKNYYYIFFESSSEIDVDAFYGNKALSKYISDEEAVQKWINMNKDESPEADPPLAIQDGELKIVLYSIEAGAFNVHSTDWGNDGDDFPSLEDVCNFKREDISSVYSLLKEGLSTSDILLKYENIVDVNLKQAKKDRRMNYTRTSAESESRYCYIKSVIDSFKLNSLCAIDARNLCEAILALLD